MVRPKALFDTLTRKKIRFFTGVPDSLLKDLCAYITDHAKGHAHVIAANEGNAVALAAGHYLATGRVAAVYLQNSGLGNAVNPLLSLADKKVYGIPMLLIIGWRGAPGTKDEPQHVAQGPQTLPLLKALNMPYVVLPAAEKEALSVLRRMCERAEKESRPVAIVVPRGVFAPYSYTPSGGRHPLTREEALHLSAAMLPQNAVIVSTTGKLSRELFELRTAEGGRHERDFLTVGSMGHASQIALGIALAKEHRPVYCFDGDGAAIMHLGGWAIIGQAAPKNFKHIVFNNGSHESVGGQPTAAFDMDLAAVAKACGYRASASASTKRSLMEHLKRLRRGRGPALLEIRVRGGSRKDLSRPTRSPHENKRDFMRFLRGQRRA